MQRLLSKRRCRSCGVSLPSLPNLSASGLVTDLDLSDLSFLLLEPELLLDLLLLFEELELLGWLEWLELPEFDFLLDLLPEFELLALSEVVRDFSRCHSQWRASIE